MDDKKLKELWQVVTSAKAVQDKIKELDIALGVVQKRFDTDSSIILDTYALNDLRCRVVFKSDTGKRLFLSAIHAELDDLKMQYSQI